MKTVALLGFFRLLLTVSNRLQEQYNFTIIIRNYTKFVNYRSTLYEVINIGSIKFQIIHQKLHIAVIYRSVL